MKPVPMPSVCKIHDGPWGLNTKTEIKWNGKIYASHDDAMRDRQRYIEEEKEKEESLQFYREHKAKQQQKQRFKKITQILHEEFNEPCHTCVCWGMDGKCMENLEDVCLYDICDDTIEDIARRLIHEIIEKEVK